jgi:hypothetical protein
MPQQSFLEQIRDESMDMLKGKRVDENLELSTIEGKEPAMVAGTGAKVDTKVTPKRLKRRSKMTS